MTQSKIPFSVELWQKGYKVVTRDGREVKFIQKISNRLWAYQGIIDEEFAFWANDGEYFHIGNRDLDLFLLPPDEIVVEVVELAEGLTTVSENFQKSKVPPGKYLLVKFD